MIELRAEVDLPVPPRRVWEVLVDFPAYPIWNPNVAIRGIAGCGNSIEWGFRRPPFKARIWTAAIIKDCEELKVLSWALSFRGLFNLEERFSLESVRGGTRVQHTMSCGGLTAKLAGGILRKRFSAAVAAANEGLSLYFQRRPEHAAPAQKRSGLGQSRTRKGFRQPPSRRR